MNNSIFGFVREQEARKNASRKNAEGLALGILAGTAIGAIAALLSAPQTGEKTRQDIKNATEKAAGAVKDTSVRVYGAVKQKSEEIIDKIRTDVLVRCEDDCCCDDDCCCVDCCDDDCCCEDEKCACDDGCCCEDEKCACDDGCCKEEPKAE